MTNPAPLNTGRPPPLVGEMARAREQDHIQERLAGERGRWPRPGPALRILILVMALIVAMGWLLTALAR